MLHIPPDSKRTTCIVGIDPGSDTLGISVLEFDIPTMTIVRTTARTIRASKLIKKNTLMADLHGERQLRVEILENEIFETLQEHMPISIAVESPFFSSRMPSAFGVLIEVMIAIKRAVYKYNSWRVVFLIDPPSVKKAIGASGGADKDKVKACILLVPDLNYQGETPLELLDEHSIDALAVAYGRFKLFLT